MSRKVDGMVNLLFSNVAERTVAKKIYHEGNSKVSSNVELLTEETPCYYLISTGGGFVEGETYETNIEVSDGAHVIVKNQTPTYVYKCENGKRTTQNTTVHITNGFLEFLTHEVIPYQYAIFDQDTQIKLDKASTLVYSDGITAGWSKDEQIFAFSEVRLKTKIFIEDELIFNDYLFLEPEKQSITELGYFEGNTNYNTLIILNPSIDELFIQELRLKLEKEKFDVRYGLSLLSISGFVLRVLSHSAHENKQLIYLSLNYFREKYYQLPPLENQ